MESILPAPADAPARPRTARAAALPWYLAASVFGSTSIIVGLLWDISWHASIGRDTFWTPAHMAIYLGGVLAGLSGGWLALKTTFAGTADERAASVRFWGFRAPLGAWVAIWGALAMLVSAPFDDWWHNAYGLDVKIISPPHMVLAAGMIGIQIGALLLAVALQNRAADDQRRPLSLAYAWTAGILLAMVATVLMEYSDVQEQHGATFYKVSCAVYPLLLAACARASRLRWPATTAAAAYMLIRAAMTWILPLFPATPLLAPIYNPIDRMWPTPFPLLLILPALALDLVMRRWDARTPRGGGRRDTLLALALGAAFLAVFLPAQWFFAELLLSPAGRNGFFGADQYPYFSRMGEWRYVFWNADLDPVSPAAAGVSFLLAAAAARLGLWWGGWMSRVKR